MNYERALSEFQTLLSMTSPDEQYYDDIICAIVCIQKQIGQKPRYFSKSNGYPKTPTCPRCKCYVEYDNFQLGYCDHCGQKIDWS